MSRLLQLNIDPFRVILFNDYLRNPDGSLEQGTFAVAAALMKFCAEANFRKELKAFNMTCIDHGFHGHNFLRMYNAVAEGEVENCVTAMLGVNTGRVPAGEVHKAADRRDRGENFIFDIGRVAGELRDGLAGFADFYGYLIARKAEINFFIDTLVHDLAPRPRNAGLSSSPSGRAPH